MSLNKKVLAAAIVGTLFAAGNAAAVDFTAGNAAAVAATVGEFAKEIRTTGAASTSTVFSGAGIDVTWASGYAYSPGEVRYVRVEASPHVLFQAATTVAVTAGATGDLIPGAINGVGTNVITFSVTADPLAGSTADAEFLLDVTARVTAIADADIKVSLYDQPSQAQAGGTTGLIAGGSVSGKHFTFIDGLEWVGTANTAVANVEAVPSFTQFTAGTVGAPGAAPFNTATLNTGLGIAATGALSPTSAALAVADLLNVAAGQSTITISGDFSYVASAGGLDANARARVGAFGTTPAAAANLTATSATFNLNTALTGNFTVAKLVGATWNPTIPATGYVAKLNGVAATPASYSVPVLPDRAVGAIVRNGVELQAPLAQIPEGWISRVVLTNTSSSPRPYTINVLTEDEVTVTTGTLDGVIPANGTKVIEDVKDIFTGHNRATLVVNVSGPDAAIQGLYQIVNPTSGSISNHVMVRPTTN